MQDNAYQIDHNRLLLLLLPTFLRKLKIVALLNAYIQPLKLIYIAFKAYKKEVDYVLAHNSQVVYLQAVLNDSFDNTLRRIKVVNAAVKEPNWIYRYDDNKPVHLYRTLDLKPNYVYRNADFSLHRPDFTIEVPIALKPSTDSLIDKFIIAMKGQTDKYKLYSKNYNIVWIN